MLRPWHSQTRGVPRKLTQVLLMVPRDRESFHLRKEVRLQGDPVPDPQAHFASEALRCQVNLLQRQTCDWNLHTYAWNPKQIKEVSCTRYVSGVLKAAFRCSQMCDTQGLDSQSYSLAEIHVSYRWIRLRFLLQDRSKTSAYFKPWSLSGCTIVAHELPNRDVSHQNRAIYPNISLLFRTQAVERGNLLNRCTG